MGKHDGKLCKACRKVALSFVDESEDIDRRLGFIAEVLVESDGTCESLEQKGELGALIRDYLDQRHILEHFFLARPAVAADFKVGLLESELLRLRLVTKNLQ